MRAVRELRVDPVLAAVFLFFSILSLVTLHSAVGDADALLVRRLVHVFIAASVVVLIAQIDLDLLRRLSVPGFVVSLVVLFLVLPYGEQAKGASRWLYLGPFSLQPSEFAKLALCMMLAWLVARRKLPVSGWQTLAALGLIGLVMLPVVLQPDLGTAILIGGAGLGVLFFAGLRWRVLLGMAVTGLALIPFIWPRLHDHQQRRILYFLDPERDPLNAGYHVIQSKIAIGSGGMYGKGWLNGTQGHLQFLPERTTDFIFSVYCEEFGFVGFVLLLAAYLVFITRGMAIALHARDRYGRLLAAALTLVLFSYMYVNMGMASGQLPVVGVPLPMMSMGGSSMLSMALITGMLMAVHNSEKGRFYLHR